MEYKKWLTYWKKSLSDSLKATIVLDKQKHFEIEDFELDSNKILEIAKSNDLIDFEERRINKKKGVTDKKSEKWVRLKYVQVLISPFKIKPATENLVYLKDKKTKYPFWYFAKLDRNGILEIPEEIFPIFQRNFLEPIADEKTEFIFSSVEKVDKATTIGKEKYDTYFDYIRYIKEVFRSVLHQNISDYNTVEYEVINNGIILLPNDDINAATGIIELYAKIINSNTTPELLKNFIDIENTEVKEPIDVPNLIDSNHLHLGQMGFEFPISISQRKSLNSFLQANDKVFAVNGPPGTGKTTLLQSIVANKLVESAIEGTKAPLILACSTNNQAVTNIIDSFSKSKTKSGSLEGRWLPDIEGYATFLPASGKTEAELIGINYKKLNGDGLFNEIENYSYLAKAKSCFMDSCSNYFNDQIVSIDSAILKLQNEIISSQTTLKNATVCWKEYLKTEDTFLNSYQSVNTKKYYSDSILNANPFKTDINALTKLEERIILYFNTESIIRKLLCFLGFKSALKSRASEIRILLRDSLIADSKELVYSKVGILDPIDHKITTARLIIKSIENWKEWKVQNSIYGNPPKTKEEYWEFEYLKIKNKAKPNCFYDELDVSIRHKNFQLALHFWEGKYLLKLESDLIDPNFDKKGLTSVTNRWQRQAMLTPCFVSTFFMAPKFFSSYKFLTKGDDGKNIFDNPPLYDFIDLLIVDEAGQVTPEVGVATFSLAKQAVIVGDIKQIEPVWNILKKIDMGNLKKSELLDNYDDLLYETKYDPKGFLASTGSIMKMAQNACNFKENGLNEKGVLLLEHRRCYDEIINYCNALAYNGQLIPLKGKANDNLIFPPMYCIHVEGNSKAINSSLSNQNEAEAIVNWLISNKHIIEEKYGKLEKSVGIITPFVGQKNSLRYSLKKAGFNMSILKLGTVHALQGAEREIILFSMVYGKGDSKNMFFDRDNKPNMLNVAVSRAKDNFIVFANTDIFDKNARTPSGILANHLVYEEKNVTV